MTVKELVNKLSEMPQDSKVIIENTVLIETGAFDVDGVLDFHDGTVVLESDYKTNYWED